MHPDLDERTLTELRPALVRFARALVPTSDAEDVVQEALLASQGADAIRAPSAWLHGTIRRIAAKRHRSAARRRVRETQPRGAQAAPGTDELSILLETQRTLLDALEDLPAQQKEALLLRYFGDLPPRRIAARLGVPLPTVKSRLHRGLEALRAKLDDRHGGVRRRWQLAFVPLLRLSAAGKALGVGLPALAAVAVIGIVGVLFLLGGLLDAGASDAGDARGVVGAYRAQASQGPSLRGRGDKPSEHDASVPEEAPSAVQDVLDLSRQAAWTLDLVFDTIPGTTEAHEALQGRTVLTPTYPDGRVLPVLVAPIQRSSEDSAACRFDLSPLRFLPPPERLGLRLVPRLICPGACLVPEVRAGFSAPLWRDAPYQRHQVDVLVGTPVAVTVRTQDGQPVRDALVGFDEGTSFTNAPWRTDAEGRCGVVRLPGDAADLLAYHPLHGWARASHRGQGDLLMELRQRTWLEGRVELASGAVVPHLPFRLTHPNSPLNSLEASLDHEAFRTDASGHFRVAVDREGAWRFHLVWDAWRGDEQPVVLRTETYTRVALPYAGLIIDPRPAGGWRADGLPLHWWVPDDDPTWREKAGAHPSPLGGSVPRFLGPVTVLGDPGAPVVFRFGNPHRGLLRVARAAFPASGLQRLGGALFGEPRPAGRLVLQLEGPQREPLRPSRLVLRSVDEPGAFDGHGVYGEFPFEKQEAGRVLVRSLPPGRWRCEARVWAPGYPFGLACPPQTVEIRPGEETRARIVAQPAVRLLVSWVREAGEAPARIHVAWGRFEADRAAPRMRSANLRTGDKAVAPGRWVQADGPRLAGRYEIRLWHARYGWHEQEVVLRSGEAHRLAFDLTGR